MLDEAAGRAFAPKLLARPAPIMRLARLDGQAERLGIHVAEHQHLTGRGIGRHARDHAIGVELRRENLALLDLLNAAPGREIGSFRLWSAMEIRHFRDAGASP